MNVPPLIPDDCSSTKPRTNRTAIADVAFHHLLGLVIQLLSHSLFTRIKLFATKVFLSQFN